MTQEKIKNILKQADLTVDKVTDGVIWTFKIPLALEPLLQNGVDALIEAGYQVEGSGNNGVLVFIRVVNPIHAEGHITEKPIKIVEVNPEDVPEVVSEVEAPEEPIEAPEEIIE